MNLEGGNQQTRFILKPAKLLKVVATMFNGKLVKLVKVGSDDLHEVIWEAYRGLVV